MEETPVLPRLPNHRPRLHPHTRSRMTAPPGTLTQHPHINQGTDEWHDARRGILTASVIGRFVTPKTIKPANNETTRALTTELVAERITGRTDPTFISDDMARGIEDEPRARDLYATKYAPVAECGFMVRTGDDWKLGYSPDGLVSDDGLIEIKSRRPKKHLATILANTVPSENLAQIQCGLLVSRSEERRVGKASGSSTGPTDYDVCA